MDILGTCRDEKCPWRNICETWRAEKTCFYPFQVNSRFFGLDRIGLCINLFGSPPSMDFWRSLCIASNGLYCLAHWLPALFLWRRPRMPIVSVTLIAREWRTGKKTIAITIRHPDMRILITIISGCSGNRIMWDGRRKTWAGIIIGMSSNTSSHAVTCESTGARKTLVDFYLF